MYSPTARARLQAPPEPKQVRELRANRARALSCLRSNVEKLRAKKAAKVLSAYYKRREFQQQMEGLK